MCEQCERRAAADALHSAAGAWLERKERRAGEPLKEIKQARAFLTKLDAVQGIVEAIVNVFGVLDAGGDIVQAGAFAKTIGERGLKIRVLDQHRTDSVLRVVGKVMAMREVGRDELPGDVLSQYPEATGGLWTRTQYLMDTPEGEGVFKRIASGAVSEYSIGYDVMKVDFEKVAHNGVNVDARVLKEVRLWEYSPVIWGMNPATATVGIKAEDEGESAPADDDIPTQPLEPVESKRGGTVGVMLQAALVSDPLYMPRWWLQEERISLEEYGLINALLIQAARLVYNGLPEELRTRDLRMNDEWMSADGPDEAKAGRVLSAKNYGLIQTAQTALNTVMTSAGMKPDDAAKGYAIASEGGAEAERTGVKAPDAVPAEPRTPPLTAADIERELTEMALAEYA